MTAPFLLHLMRHGEPALAGRMLGHTDSAVTAAGIAACYDQAAGMVFERIISSDLIRARACADAIGMASSLTVSTDAAWREINFGAWDGLAADEIESEALSRFWEDPDLNPPPGGERWSSLIARVSRGIEALAAEPTLVLTHGGTMRAALALLCGFSQSQVWAFDLPYASCLSLRVWPGAQPVARILAIAQ